MTLRVVQLPSIADQLDDLLVYRTSTSSPGVVVLRPKTYGVGSKRCACGATKSPRKEYCSDHPQQRRR